MKKGKSPAKLVPKAWDFRHVPGDEIEPCYLYEYSKESPLIVSKITDALDTKRKNMVSATGDTLVKTELEPEIHFVVDFAEKGIFPEKHWLQIDPERRRKHAVLEDRWRVGHVDPASMEAKPLLIYPLEYFLELRRRFPWVGLGAKRPDHSGPHVFDVCWARSKSKLKEDFGKWLDSHPESQQGFQAKGGSQRTSPRDWLNALGALRLMRAYERDVVGARDHTWKVAGTPLYKEQGAWIKAANKAEEHLRVFQRKMLGI